MRNEAVPREHQILMLQSAWLSAVQDGPLPQAAAARYVDTGATVSDVYWVARLARSVLAAGPGRAGAGIGSPSRGAVAANLLDLVVEVQDEAFWSSQDLLAWAKTAAGAPQMRFTEHRGYNPVTYEDLKPWVGWRLPPGIAALAWAAGLSPFEAHQQHLTGDLTPEGLRALASLRGFRLPGHST